MQNGDKVTNPYRALFTMPGARVFVAAGFIGRMSMSMVGIAIVLLVFSVTGSYGTAGAVSATYALALAAASPTAGRLADRYGQHRVLRPVAVVHGVSVTALIVCAQLDAPIWTLFPAAAASGMSSPPIGAMVRVRWSHLLHGTTYLHTAFSLESVADEVIFITGPVIVTFLATSVYPAAGVAVAGLFRLTGSLALAAQRRTEPPPRPRTADHSGSVLRAPGLIVLTVIFLVLGSVFGAVEVSAIAFAQEEGHRGLAGVLLACYAFGSMVAGLWYGARHWTTPLDRRFMIGLVLMAAGLVPVVVIPDLYLMMVVIFFSGLAISPTIIPAFGLVERQVPAHQLTEGLTWVSTSVGFGVAVGVSVAGRLVDAHGSGGAFVFPICAGVGAVALALAGASRFGKRETVSSPISK